MEVSSAAGVSTEGRRSIVAASALLFAVLFVVGLLMAGSATDTENKTAEEILKTFRDNKNIAVVSAYLLVVAGLAFLPVAWAVLRRVHSGLSDLAEQVARSAAMLFVAMVLSAGIVLASLAAAVVFGSEDDPPDVLVRFIPQIGFGLLLVAGALSVALFLAIVSRAGQTTRSVPTWFWALSYVAAVAMLAAVVFIPMILLPIWAVGAAVVLRAESSQSA